MALKSGYGYKTFQSNVSDMVREGYPRAQAVAASFHSARQSFFKAHPHGLLPEWLTPLGGTRHNPNKPRGKNPVPPSSVAETAAAKRLYTTFTGHRAAEIEKRRAPKFPKALAVIGFCDAICYTTVRDGITESYKHEFADKAMPMLCVSPDGKQLFLLDGDFQFGERGIVDNE